MNSVRTFEGLQYNWYIWRMCGMYPPKRLRGLYFLYTIWFNVFIIFGFTLTTVTKIFLVENIRTFCANMAMTAELVTCNMKYIYVYLNFQKLKSMDSALGEMDDLATTPRQKEHLKSVVSRCHRIFKVLTAEFCACWLASGVSMAVMSFNRILLYPAWFPFDWENTTWICELLAFYQFIAVGLEIFLNASSDTFPPILLSVLEGHYQCLAMSLEDIEEGTEENSESNYEELVRCIQYHQCIERNFVKISKLISRPLFIQFFATGVVLCCSAAIILLFDAQTAESCYYYIYGVGILIQIFFACFYGTEFNWKTDLLTTQLYSCNWITQNRKFKKALLIFIANSLKSKIVFAGGIVPITLNTYISIVKSSYSLLALIKGMDI